MEINGRYYTLELQHIIEKQFIAQSDSIKDLIFEMNAEIEEQAAKYGNSENVRKKRARLFQLEEFRKVVEAYTDIQKGHYRAVKAKAEELERKFNHLPSYEYIPVWDRESIRSRSISNAILKHNL